MISEQALDKAIARMLWKEHHCQRVIERHGKSEIVCVKALIDSMVSTASSTFADLEAMAWIADIYAAYAEEVEIAYASAVLRGDSHLPEAASWVKPASIRIDIPLRAQFDHSFALASTTNRHEAITDMPPAEPFNAFIAMAEQSAAFGAPVIVHTPEWPVREHMVCWIAFDSQSATGRLLTEEAEKLSQWHAERAAWSKLPTFERLFNPRVFKKHPMPADYVPCGEYERRNVWERDTRRRVALPQGRFFTAAMPMLHQAWKSLSVLQHFAATHFSAGSPSLDDARPSASHRL